MTTKSASAKLSYNNKVFTLRCEKYDRGTIKSFQHDKKTSNDLNKIGSFDDNIFVLVNLDWDFFGKGKYNWLREFDQDFGESQKP